MLNNKRILDETSATRTRLMQSIRDLTVSYSALVSGRLLKKQANLGIEDIQKEIQGLKDTKDLKESEMTRLKNERNDRLSQI